MKTSSYTCSCCPSPKTYANKRGLRKHQMKYDPEFIFGGSSSEQYELGLREAYERSPKACDACCEVLSYELFKADPKRRFCNRSCAASVTANRLGTGTKGYATRGLTCLGCNQKYDGRGGSYYHSNECRIEHRKSILVKKWLAGEVSGSGATGNIRSPLRNYVLEQAGHKCSDCGWHRVHPKTGKVPVQIDHIDGNSTNNVLSNLRVLCPNCHSLTLTYGSLNNGNGRDARRDRRKKLQNFFSRVGNADER